MSRGDARRRLEQALADHGRTVRGNSARCPGPDHANGDRNPSLSISDRRDGQGVVISCKAGNGCSTDAILEALGMSGADLFDEPRQRASAQAYEVAATYTYTDEHGSPLFCAERRVPKDFRQYRVVNGRKEYRLGDVRRVLYRLPQVIEAVKNGQTIYVVEGEKDVHAIEAAGAVATCNPMGAGKWRREFADVLAGADVIIVADRDEPGRKHAADVAASLDGKAKSVRIVEAAEGKDASDHLAARYGLDDFREAELFNAVKQLPDDGLAAIAARYTPVDWQAAWKGQPEDLDWLIEPILERGTVNALFAKPGTGKSLLALEWALRLIREGRSVIYVDDENRITDIVERLQAFGAEPGELARLLLYSFAGLPPLDTTAGGVHLLAVATSGSAELVVLDTTTRMVQGKENDSDTFLQLYRCSLAPLKSRAITVLRLDHPGKDGDRGQRGSSAKDGDVDTIWQLTEEAQGRRYKLIRQKSRSGHGGDTEIPVERKYVPLRHELSTGDYSRVTELADKLEKLSVPLDANRDRCRTALSAIGVTARNDVLSKVIKHRRSVPGNSGQAGTAGTGSDAADPCPHFPPIGGDRGQSPVRDEWPEGTYGEAVNS